MKRLRQPLNPSLAARLRLALGVLLGLLVAVSFVGVGRLFELRQDFEDSSSRAFQLELAAERMRSTFVIEQAALRRVDADRRGARAAFEQAGRTAAAATRAARELAVEDRIARRVLADRSSAAERWRATVARPLLAGRSVSARRSSGLAADVSDADNRLIARQQERRQELRSEVRSDSRRTVLFILVGLGTAFLAAMLFFSGLVRAMRRPLDSLLSAARRLARGDLDARAQVSGPTEMATLGAAFNEMAQDLQDAYRGVEDERARLATMIESLGDGLLTVDPGGHVTLLNPTARRLLPSAAPGATLAEALGDLAPEPRVLAQLERGTISGGELRLGRDDQVLAVSVAPLRTREGGTVLSIRDVSERARLEALKDEFVSTVSHELRSPLTSIKGFAELLLLDQEHLSTDQAENVRVIDKSTSQLVELVNDLLDLARSDADRLRIDPRPCEVAPLLEEVAGLLERRFEEKDQRLVVEVPEDLPPLWADPGRIEQVLTNLVTNAHLYTQPGATVEVGASAEADRVRIYVTDDGPGIPEEQQSRIFERFYRGAAGERQAVSGSGLGLSIAKSIVELHGGEITLDSQTGVGTTFHIVLPTAPAGAEGAAPAVLVLEADTELAGELAERLGHAGLGGAAVHDANEAARRLASTGFDLVLVDTHPSAAGGLELIEAVATHGAPPPEGIVAISGRGAQGGRTGRRVVLPPARAEALVPISRWVLARGRKLIVACHDPRLRAEVTAAFAAEGHRPLIVDSAIEAIVTARSRSFDALLIHDRLPGADALHLALTEHSREAAPPRVVLLGDDGPREITIGELAEQVASLAGAETGAAS